MLEDLGVTPEVDYRMTRRDVLEGNRDLIDTAIDQLADAHAVRHPRRQGQPTP